jgi:hypothetical protein
VTGKNWRAGKRTKFRGMREVAEGRDEVSHLTMNNLLVVAVEIEIVVAVVALALLMVLLVISVGSASTDNDVCCSTSSSGCICYSGCRSMSTEQVLQH